MLERNKIGHQIRQYFIEMEKKARELSIPPDPEEFIAKAVIEAHKILDRKNQIIEEQKVEIEDQAEKIT